MSLLPRNAPGLHALPFPSRRSAMLGLGPMVATSQPLAAQAGLAILQAGGNAFDAAVACSAMLNVVEPTGGGIGGDAFALLYRAHDRQLLALNGSGRAPATLTSEALRAAGHRAMPERGPHSVTVPGTVDAWASLLVAEGRFGLDRLLAPAIDAAEHGYPVSELVAGAWQASESLLAARPEARAHYLPGGRAPRAGEIVRLPGLARALRRIAAEGPAGFYRGPTARAIVACLRAEGGQLSEQDLAEHRSTWERPIGTDFHGIRVWECPPNGQGLAALLALAVLRGWNLGACAWGGAEHLHPMIEAMRLGLADAAAWVADPAFATLPLDQLLGEAYAAERRALLRPDRALPEARAGLSGGTDTVYMAVVDAEGNACSFINSNYMGFGSGLVAGDTAIALQNRAAGFSLAPDHPNALAPRKRPFHTIIPGLATRPDGRLFACFGVMGGPMQAQGHLQLLTNLRVFGMDPQRALDAPRFQVMRDGGVALEAWFGDATRTALERYGHPLVPREDTPPMAAFGGGQCIGMTEDGVRVGGSDPRKDGMVALA